MDVNIAGFPQNLFLQKVTIPSGASASEMVATQGMALIGLFTPTNGWTAANIGFKVCWNGRDIDLVTAYNDGGVLEQAIISSDAAAARIAILFPSPDALFTPYIQLVSVLVASPMVTTPVNQGADRVLYLLFRRYLS
jgi:hypothetical protein